MYISKTVSEAMKRVDRKDFVGQVHEPSAYVDAPLPIGYGQTISQPTTVGIMLTMLELAPGMKVLEVGSGSGWVVALISHIVGNSGEVIGVERIPKLVELGKKNIEKYCRDKNVAIYNTEKEIGYQPRGPYDRIIVSASSTSLPTELVYQLKTEGIMIIPILYSIWKVMKKSDDPEDIIKQEYPGFVFVPLVY
ncbi:protein-L-isoaspartate O-methyltransferase [candidate division WWE3 bacterium]|jgi:protein-L-isoaspartate(D-aspartate) O-methyltransferase|uniref:Protein-L-isoaspartate O-methyltransferase n=1 Tax=candidate division WWE3 bacterium TaxID=2053526 RepID=A0A3A4ZFW7_UNCKA|nr:MAG: protein-L-isoaspartate O-methyltransferase [candidate division WWE3 bacterium]